MGMTTEDFDKAVTARLIKANELVPALAKSFRELASPGLKQAMDQLGVSQQRFYNALYDASELMFQGGLKESLAGFFDEFAEQMASPHVRRTLLDLSLALSTIVNLLSLMANLIPGIIHDFGRLKEAVPWIVPENSALNLAQGKLPGLPGIVQSLSGTLAGGATNQGAFAQGGSVPPVEITVGVKDSKWSDILDIEWGKHAASGKVAIKGNVKE